MVISSLVTPMIWHVNILLVMLWMLLDTWCVPSKIGKPYFRPTGISKSIFTYHNWIFAKATSSLSRCSCGPSVGAEAQNAHDLPVSNGIQWILLPHIISTLTRIFSFGWIRSPTSALNFFVTHHVFHPWNQTRP